MLKRYLRPVLAASLWAALCLAAPAIAETLNGVKPAGLPLGFWIVAQGAPLMLALAAFVVANPEPAPETSPHEGRSS